MDQNSIILFIIMTLVGTLQLIIGWNLKQLYKRIEKIELDMVGMKSNYLARFDDAKDHRFSIEKSILTAIAEMDSRLAVHIVQTNGAIG